MAREVLGERRGLPSPARLWASRVIGTAALPAPTVAELRASAPADARWVLAGLTQASELWKAEARWWARVGREASSLSRKATPGVKTLIGAVALMARDAWQVRFALELADLGGRPLEILDEVE